MISVIETGRCLPERCILTVLGLPLSSQVNPVRLLFHQFAEPVVAPEIVKGGFGAGFFFIIGVEADGLLQAFQGHIGVPLEGIAETFYHGLWCARLLTFPISGDRAH